MKNILITCFEPFGGEEFNASMAVAEAMPENIAGYAVHKLTLPVEFGRSADIAEKAAREISAEYIFCFGEARSRKAVTPEYAAINLRYASIPDNAGNKPMDEPVISGGREAYFTPFPARMLAEGIKAGGVPSALSYSAGVYVCNDLYYRLLRAFEGSGAQVLFIHVPRMEAEEYEKAAQSIAEAIGKMQNAKCKMQNL